MPDQDERDPRVYFAIERTFLAWTRTGLALMTFGFVIARLGLFLRQMQEMGGGPGAMGGGGGQPMPDASAPSISLWIGTGVVVLGILVQGLSLWEYRQLRRKFLAGQGIIGGGLPLPAIVGVTLLLAGLGLALYLVTLR
jgi:putative membrane protein